MSVFGDDTPHQAVYDIFEGFRPPDAVISLFLEYRHIVVDGETYDPSLKMVQDDFNLSNAELAAVVVKVADHFADPYDYLSDIAHKKVKRGDDITPEQSDSETNQKEQQ